MSTPEQPTSNVLRSVDLTSNLSPDASTRSDVVSALSLGVDIPDGVATTWLDRGSFPSDVSESAVREREAALARKAERQYGVFSGSQAQEAGFPRRTIYERVRRGSWVRVSGDSYRVAASAETWQQPIVAAWLAVGDPSAISGGPLWPCGSSPPRCRLFRRSPCPGRGDLGSQASESSEHGDGRERTSCAWVRSA